MILQIVTRTADASITNTLHSNVFGYTRGLKYLILGRRAPEIESRRLREAENVNKRKYITHLHVRFTVLDLFWLTWIPCAVPRWKVLPQPSFLLPSYPVLLDHRHARVTRPDAPPVALRFPAALIVYLRIHKPVYQFGAALVNRYVRLQRGIRSSRVYTPSLTLRGTWKLILNFSY